MDLIPIKDWEDIYSFDKNTNGIYNTKFNRFIKPRLTKNYLRYTFHKNNKRYDILLHRIIYQIYNPEIDISNLFIDHIDRNTKNNNIENLRLADRSQNQCNTKMYKNNILGVKNITLARNKFVVRIRIYNKTYRKSFYTLEEAIKHRDIKLIELHGEFSNIYNKID